MGQCAEGEVRVLAEQRVLVAGYVQNEWLGVVTCEVALSGSDGRSGQAMIAGRARAVYQRYPAGGGEDYDWVLSGSYEDIVHSV